MKNPPFLSVSALQNCADVRVALQAFTVLTDRKPTAAHFACIGFAADPVTILKNQPPSPRKVDSLSELIAGMQLIGTGPVKAAIHFDLQGYASTKGSLDKLLIRCATALPALHQLLATLGHQPYLLQLNGVVAAEEITKLRHSFPNATLIYPLGKALLQLSNQELITHVQEVSPHVDYWLFDPSGGMGKTSSTEEMKLAAHILSRYAPQCSLGIAGGLRAENVKSQVEIVAKILGSFNFSLDVESGIRNKESDRIDPTLLTHFISCATQALGY